MKQRTSIFLMICALITATLPLPSMTGRAQSSTQNISWTTNSTDLTITGNSVQKTSGCDGCATGAASQQSIASGDGYVEFTATETNKLRYCGLSHGAVLSGDYTQFAFAIKLSDVAVAEVREAGVYKADTTYSANDVFRIAIESGVVKYYRNGSVFYTNSSPSISYPQVVSASFYSTSATLTSAVISGAGSGDTVPDTYALVTHREPILPPALPDVSAGAGTIITDPVFGTRIMRLSDATIEPNNNAGGVNGRGTTIHTTSAADHNAINTDGTLCYIINAGGSILPKSVTQVEGGTLSSSFLAPTTNSPDYNGNTSGTPGVSGVGPRVVKLANEPDFSFENPNYLYGAKLVQSATHAVVQRYDFSNDSYTDIIDLSSTGFDLSSVNQSLGNFIAYCSVSNSDDGTYGTAHGERLCVLYGSGNADFEYLVAIVNASDGSVVKILDTRHLKSGTSASTMTAYAGSVTPFERTASQGGSLSADNGTSIVYTVSSTASGAANGFVPIQGVIKIGSELIEFTSRSVTGTSPNYTVTLSGLTRGARGTTQTTHTAGSAVLGESVDLHGGTITRDGHYVYLTKSGNEQAPGFGADVVVWDIDNDTLTHITVDNTGHFVAGFDLLINQNGQHDAADWELRSADSPNTGVEFLCGASTNERYNVAVDGLSGSGNFQWADHTSWNNAKPSQAQVPCLSGTFRYPSGGNSAYNYASRARAEWDDELVLMDTSTGSPDRFWRAAMHRSIASNDLKLTGTASFSSTTNTTTLTGTGTQFTTELAVGDYISVCSWDGSSGGVVSSGEARKVTAIADNTHLTVDHAWTTTASGQNVFAQGKGTTFPPFYYTPRAVISQTGKYAIFTSNWNGALGVPARTDTAHGAFRTDVFLVELPVNAPTTPTVSNNAASSVSNTSEAITFDTDQLGDSVVEYSTDTSYGSSAKDYVLKTTGHSVTLVGLTPGTAYNYRIKSRNRGVTSSAVTGTFTTSGTAPTDFVTDSFTESSDTTLASHTGEVGATWTKHPDSSYSSTATVNASSDRLYPSGTVAYYASGTPPSADYYVQADFYYASTISVNAGICVRMDTSTNTMYSLRLNSGTVWELRKIVGGTQTTLASSTSNLPTAGQTKTVKLVVSGSSLTVYINGVQDTNLSASDSSITAAGRAGVRFAGAASSTTGFHLDNFSAR